MGENKLFYYHDYPLHNSFGNDRLCDRPTIGYVIYYNEKNKNIIIDDKYDILQVRNINATRNDVYNENKHLLSKGYVAIYPPIRKGNILGRWCRGITEIKSLLKSNLIDIVKTKNKWEIYPKIYVDKNYRKNQTYPLKSVIEFSSNSGTTNLSSILNNKNFNNPKPIDLLKHILNAYALKKDITILDFFAGSGTTGQAVMELNQEDGGNRRFILCTNNENDIAKNICWERLYRVINGKGSKGQKFDWKYSKQTPYLSNNTITTFEIKHYKCDINQDPKLLFDIATNQLKKLNGNFNLIDINLSRALSSLHPFNQNKE